MIFNEVFDYCYHVLRGTAASVRDAYDRKRYNRALLALRCQNYFLGASFQNVTGAAGVIGVGRTQPLERPLIVRGGGVNAIFIGGTGLYFDVPESGAVNLIVERSGPSRMQINRNALRSSHYFSSGEAQYWELDWPQPLVLDPNEVILVTFNQVSACQPNTLYNVGFYGVVVDEKMRCEETLVYDLKQQIVNTIPKPRYIHLKTTAGGGTIVLPGIGNNERAVANTIEVPEHMLILGWRRFMVGMGPHVGVALSTTIRAVVTGGPAFSRIEIPVNAFEYFNSMDAGYFRFAVPHFIPKGSSLSLSITSSITRQQDQFEGEIELLCVTI